MTTAERERQLMAAITAGWREKGFSPSMRELAKAVGLSLTRVAQILSSCERKGLISRHRNVARSFVVLGQAEEGQPENRSRPARSSKTKSAK